MKKNGIKKIFICNRTLEKAEIVKKRFPFIEIIEWKNIEEETEKMDVIINATSLGLKGGNNFTQEFKNTKYGLVYYDVVYNPNETILLKKFKERGATTFNGLEMFIYQGQKSFSLWNNIIPNLDEKIKQTIETKLK